MNNDKVDYSKETALEREREQRELLEQRERNYQETVERARQRPDRQTK